MPKAEVLLWVHLKGRALGGYKFRRQVSIGRYVVDFYCPSQKLVLELDGDSHFSEEAKIYDEIRQSEIESLGLKVLRFTNDEIYSNVDEVVGRIEKALPPPLPLLRKEGT